MIVLDEQLLGRGIAAEISEWYPGSVRFVVDLRPGSVIKDDAIPLLLRQQRQPTFVTINARDFWLKAVPDPRFCVVCFAWPDSRTAEIPQALRTLLRRSQLETKASRMGKVIRVAEGQATYYSSAESGVQLI